MVQTILILENPHEITGYLLKIVQNSADYLVGFGRTDKDPLLLESNILEKYILSFNSKGKKVRYITNIHKHNIESCKKLMDIVHLRHLDDIQGGIIINDNEYLNLLEERSEKPITSTPVHLYSKNKWLVGQQKMFFDMLWDRAVSAAIRIKQIELGLEEEVFELIRDEQNIVSKYQRALKSLNYELYIFYSTSEQQISLNRAQRIFDSIIEELLKNGSKNRIKISILLLTEDHIKPSMPTVAFEKLQMYFDIKMKFVNRNQSQKTLFPKDLMILMIDGKELFISETKDIDQGFNYRNENDSSITIYSNDRSIVSTYYEILNILWSRDELFRKSELANTRLKFQEKLQREFVHNFANGLRNPIQPILGFSEILLEFDKTTHPDHNQIVNVIHVYAQKLAKHVNNMIDITEIENHTFELRKELFDIGKLVVEIVDQYRKNNFGINKVRFVLSIAYKDEIKIFADRNRIRLAIENLITNSLESSKNIRITILLTSPSKIKNEKDKFVFVNVKDDGIGVDSEILPTLFSKFVTNSKDGLGLGLYLTKNIIESHEGEIWGKNNKNNKGALFGFKLPVN